MTNQQTNLTQTIARYAVSRGYRRVLGVVLAFLRPKMLGPEDFGLWALMRLIPKYSYFAQLGTLDALRYLIPHHRGRNEQQQIQVIEETVCTFSFLANVCVAAGLVIVAFSVAFGPKLRWGLVAMGATILLLWVHDYLITVLKGREAFGLITRTNYFYITVVFGLTIPALFLFGLYGLFVSFPLAYLITAIYIRLHISIRFRFGFCYPLFKNLVKRGFPIMALAFMIGLVSTSDRLLVSSLLGVEQTGYYGLAALVISFLMDTPGAAREVMEMRLMKTKDRMDTVSVAFRYIFDPLRKTAYMMPFLIGPVFLLVPSLVEFLLPRYQASVQVIQMLSIGAFFFAFTHPFLCVIIARGWQLSAIPFVLVAIGVNVVTSVVLVRIGFGIVGVATGSVISFFALFISIYGFLDAKFGLTKIMPKDYWWRLSLPFPFTAGLLFALEYAIVDGGWVGALQRLAGVMLYTLIMSGLFFWDRANRANTEELVEFR